MKSDRQSEQWILNRCKQSIDSHYLKVARTIAKRLQLNEETIVIVGYVGFYQDTDLHERIDLAVTCLNGRYFATTSYRNLPSAALTEEIALELINKFCSNGFTFDKQPNLSLHLSVSGTKSDFIGRYLNSNDTYQPISILAAIAKAESHIETVNALSKIFPKCDSRFEKYNSDIKALGSLVGSEQCCVPENSSSADAITSIRTRSNYFFNQGYKSGVLRNSPKPDFDQNLCKEKIEATAALIESNSRRAFEHDIQQNHKSYDFPQELHSLSISELLELIERHQEMAQTMCDGTNCWDLAREEYGQDVIQQARDMLLFKGYKFSETEISNLGYLNWPLTKSEAREQAIKEIASGIEKDWRNNLNRFVYGAKRSVDVERENTINIVIGCITQTSNTTDRNPSSIEINISRSSGNCSVVKQERLRELINTLEAHSKPTCSKPSFSISYLSPERDTEAEYDANLFWSFQCIPSPRLEFWKALIALHNESNRPINISPREFYGEYKPSYSISVIERDFILLDNTNHKYHFEGVNQAGRTNEANQWPFQ